MGSIFGGGSQPTPPDPNVTIPLQTQANKDTFDYMLEASRANQYSPYGSQTWEKTPTFDRAGYRAAVGDWRDAKGTAAPAPAPTTGYYAPDPYQESGQVWVPAESAPGSPTTTAGRRPDKADFTTNSWTYRQTLSPEQQAIFDADQASRLGQSETLGALTQRVQQTAGQPINWGSVPGITSSVNPAQLERYDGAGGITRGLAGYREQMGELNPNAINRRAANAQYRVGSRYLDEQTQNQTQALEARLAEQGFVPGTPGYAKAMETFQDTNARAYADARDRATLLGSQVGNQNFDNSMQGLQGQIAALLSEGNFDINALGFNNSAALQQQNADTNAATFGNTARTQGLAELLMQRNAPLNELNAMRTGTQVNIPNNPAQYSTPNLQTPDVMGAYNTQYQGQVANSNVDNASSNAMLGLLGDAAGMFAGMPPGTVSSLLTGLGSSGFGNGLAYGNQDLGQYFG